jgi:hypothetical protein
MVRLSKLVESIARANALTDCYVDLNCCDGCRERYAHLNTLERLTQLPESADDMQWLQGPIPEDLRGDAFRKGYSDAIDLVRRIVDAELRKLEPRA